MIHPFREKKVFLDFVVHEHEHLDCLVLDGRDGEDEILEQFHAHNILLPTVLLGVGQPQSAELHPSKGPVASDVVNSSDQSWQGSRERADATSLYHGAVYWLPIDNIQAVTGSIEQAIAAFLKLPAWADDKKEPKPLPSSMEDVSRLKEQQQRLSTKLNERLGYLGVYYKRDPVLFLRRMDPEARQSFIAELKEDYRTIILNYFSEGPALNQNIDRYVTTAFFADVPTAQIVEIHMELMDEFSKQLKLEGRNEEILLDYRLTLIDTLANLCELYRRSIPRTQ